MFCAKCGANVVDGQAFCTNCGENLGKPTIQEPVNTQPPPQESMPTPVGFILGLVSLVAWILPLAGYPVTICGIIFSAKHLKQTNKTAKTLAIIGLVLSILFLLVTLFNSFLGVIIALSTM